MKKRQKLFKQSNQNSDHKRSTSIIRSTQRNNNNKKKRNNNDYRLKIMRLKGTLMTVLQNNNFAGIQAQKR